MIIDKFLIIKKSEVKSYLKSIDGHFAIIAKRHDLTLVVDKIRSTPLFFTKIKNNIFIDFDPKNLTTLEAFDKEIDCNSNLEIAMSDLPLAIKQFIKTCIP